MRGKRFESQLTEKEYQDLCDFEGNANGFKILTESRDGREGGLRLSYATLGAFMKYPKESLPKKPTSYVGDKKYGYFQSDKASFLEVAEELGLIKRSYDDGYGFSRHPLTFLVEAADDICYTIIDFEDGINLGYIQEDYALEYLIKLVKNTINNDKYNVLKNTQDRISYLRALAVNTLIEEAVQIFIENEENILNGTFSKSLLNLSKYKAQMEDIINLSIKNIYQSDNVINKEIAGFRIINQLLSIFTKAMENHFNDEKSNYDKLVMKVFPEALDLNHKSFYMNILNVANFISKLSDSRALLMYNKLIGRVL